jgi:hypothetical protein
VRRSSAAPLSPKPVSGNAGDHDCDSYQCVVRVTIDRVDYYEPADRDENNRRERMTRNSRFRRRFAFAKDEDTARSEAKENHVDRDDVVENAIVSSEESDHDRE